MGRVGLGLGVLGEVELVGGVLDHRDDGREVLEVGRHDVLDHRVDHGLRVVVGLVLLVEVSLRVGSAFADRARGLGRQALRLHDQIAVQ